MTAGALRLTAPPRTGILVSQYELSLEFSLTGSVGWHRPAGGASPRRCRRDSLYRSSMRRAIQWRRRALTVVRVCLDRGAQQGGD